MKEFINMFKQKGYLLSPELLELQSSKLEEIYSKIQHNPFKLKILDNSAIQQLQIVKPEKTHAKNFATSFELLKKFPEDNSKRNVTSFVEMYNDRFNKLSAYLKKRPELSKVTSIKNVKENNNSDKISVIGMVSNISLSKNNNYIITVEDPTEKIRIMVTEKNSELYNEMGDIILDEVIGITGSKSRGYIFADNIFFPDIPHTYEFKKSTDEVYAVFISDIHIGSSSFMEESFKKFIDWISGKTGSEEQKEISSKVGYLFVNGDVVDGVGIYPNQKNDLAIKDIGEQFKEFTNFLKKIPERIQIILTPGNHDGVRLAEPQPPYPKKYFEELKDRKNIHLVPNPAYVKIHAVNGNSGFIVLAYHGYAFDNFCLDIPSIKNAGGYGAVEKVIEFLLKKRHLTPVHGMALFSPSSTDNLVIDIVPDIVTTGHVHNLRTGTYNHVSMIACSCFERMTGETYAEKLGHIPTPAVVPIINLKTRKVSVIDFN